MVADFFFASKKNGIIFLLVVVLPEDLSKREPWQYMLRAENGFDACLARFIVKFQRSEHFSVVGQSRNVDRRKPLRLSTGRECMRISNE
jgi:hypothetical protein